MRGMRLEISVQSAGWSLGSMRPPGEPVVAHVLGSGGRGTGGLHYRGRHQHLNAMGSSLTRSIFTRFNAERVTPREAVGGDQLVPANQSAIEGSGHVN